MDIINNTEVSQYLENFDNEVIQNISKIVPALAALEDALLRTGHPWLINPTQLYGLSNLTKNSIFIWIQQNHYFLISSVFSSFSIILDFLFVHNSDWSKPMNFNNWPIGIICICSWLRVACNCLNFNKILFSFHLNILIWQKLLCVMSICWILFSDIIYGFSKTSSGIFEIS